MCVCRYLPQMWLNHKRRSTDGWNISNALTDMSGGFFSLAQQFLDAYALQVLRLSHSSFLFRCFLFSVFPMTPIPNAQGGFGCVLAVLVDPDSACYGMVYLYLYQVFCWQQKSWRDHD